MHSEYPSEDDFACFLVFLDLTTEGGHEWINYLLGPIGFSWFKLLDGLERLCRQRTMYTVWVLHPSKLAVTPPYSSVGVMVRLAAMSLMAGCDWVLSQKQQKTNMSLKKIKYKNQKALTVQKIYYSISHIRKRWLFAVKEKTLRGLHKKNHKSS